MKEGMGFNPILFLSNCIVVAADKFQSLSDIKMFSISWSLTLPVPLELCFADGGLLLFPYHNDR